MGTKINEHTSAAADGVISRESYNKIVSPEQQERQIIQSAATSRVISDPLPGPMLDAIVYQELEVKTSKGIVIFRPVVASDFKTFKQLNSPHYRTMIEQGNKEELAKIQMEIEDEELYEMIYQFSHPSKKIREELKKGREYFRELATEEIGDKYNVTDLGILLEGIAQQLQKGFSTMMAHGAKEDDKEKDALDELILKKNQMPIDMNHQGGILNMLAVS